MALVIINGLEKWLKKLDGNQKKIVYNATDKLQSPNVLSAITDGTALPKQTELVRRDITGSDPLYGQKLPGLNSMIYFVPHGEDIILCGHLAEAGSLGHHDRVYVQNAAKEAAAYKKAHPLQEAEPAEAEVSTDTSLDGRPSKKRYVKGNRQTGR